jgi:hypothetical protein
MHVVVFFFCKTFRASLGSSGPSSWRMVDLLAGSDSWQNCRGGYAFDPDDDRDNASILGVSP